MSGCPGAPLPREARNSALPRRSRRSGKGAVPLGRPQAGHRGCPRAAVLTVHGPGSLKRGCRRARNTNSSRLDTQGVSRMHVALTAQIHGITSSGGKAANGRQPRGDWDAEAARPQGRPGGPAHSRCLGRLGTGEGLWPDPGRAPTTPRGARRLLGPLSCSQEPPSGRGWASVTRGRMVSWWRIDVSRERERAACRSCFPGASSSH